MRLDDRTGSGNEGGADWGWTCGGFGVMEMGPGCGGRSVGARMCQNSLTINLN